MLFTQKKVLLEKAEELLHLPVHSIRPYSLMPAPVYLLLKRNQKFISLKAPLDFFSPEEISHLKERDELYLSEFADQTLPFQEAGRKAAKLLSWSPTPESRKSTNVDEFLGPTPFEVSDLVIRLIGPLWSNDLILEPFFTAIFCDFLCDPLDSSQMKNARDADFLTYERAILQSSWAVFSALHLGYCELAFLNRLRRDAFALLTDDHGKPALSETWELTRLAQETLADPYQRCFDVTQFRKSLREKKLSSRLTRVELKLVNEKAQVPSIFGQKGFCRE